MVLALFKRRHERAVVPEQEAIKAAKSKGYQVLGTQVVRYINLTVDDKLVRIEVRADLALKKWGRRYVGQLRGNSDPAEKDVRLTLLEFREAFQADGALLFDPAGKSSSASSSKSAFRCPSSLC